MDVFPYLRNGGKNEKLNINFSKLNYVNFLSFRHVVLSFHAWCRPCMKKAVLNDQLLRFSFQFKKLDVSYNVRSQYLNSLMPFFLRFNVFNEPRAGSPFILGWGGWGGGILLGSKIPNSLAPTLLNILYGKNEKTG